MPAPLRFLFVGPFTAAPKGERITVSGERMADVMARLPLRTDVRVTDRLGAGGERSYAMQLASARALRIADVIAGHAPLSQLAEIATALVRPTGAITIEQAVEQVRRLAGDGPLARALSELDASPAPAAPTSTAAQAPAPAPSSASSGDIFAQADLPSGGSGDADTVRAAKSGLDAFIGAMRGGKPKAPSGRNDAQQRAAALLLDALDATAAEMLSHEPIATLEANWRGIKLVLSESPGHDRLAIELLDTTAAQQADALAAALAHGTLPDLVVVTTPIDDPATLASLAECTASHFVPVLATLDPAALEVGELPMQAWSALRRRPVSGWASVATNDIVVAHEPTRVGPRVAFAAPVFAVAAMMAASLRRDGTFGDAFGRAGALASPASQPVGDRRSGVRNVPVRAEMTPDAMRQMAEIGVVVVGSEPGGERLLAVGAPMVAVEDGPSLPGRVLVGRAVRAAIAARADLDRDATDEALAQALLRAAASVLPDGPPGTCALEARRRGPTGLDVTVKFRAAATGRPFGVTLST
ncbi:MAG: hypothetical protein K1X88_05340 [Nannocystaceae bacterium]|nr:hypothetical protein [Nannocystaceae bacterium]